jgi:2-polyprenyl-3-methyl-5-hydroxy-6-metoxy-1,4-benzoquinol methylase
VSRQSAALTDNAWDAVDPFEGEAHNWWVRLEHLGRYLFAAGLLRREGASRVLDAACGTGFGAGELAREGLAVVGMDNDAEVLAYARERYSSPRVELECLDLDDEGAGPRPGTEPFDAVVSFETLEHLLEPELALRRLADRLAAGGIAICSLPIRSAEGRTALGMPANGFHKQLLSLDGSRRLLEAAGLEVEYRLGQSLIPRLMKREQKLSSKKAPSSRPSSIPALSEPDALRSWAQLLGSPMPEDVEESYSVIYVARKPATPPPRRLPSRS